MGQSTLTYGGFSKNSLLTSAIVCLCLSAAVWIVYAPTLQHGFQHFDDPMFALDPNVQKGLTAETVRWAFGFQGPIYWHPLTWLSLMLDRQVFGPGAGGFHLTNVLLHNLDVLLLFLVLLRMTGRPWPSALAAALFAVHPMHVESVAWVAERKDPLSLCFGLLAILCYARYARQPSLKRYLPVLLFFILGLMSKAMLVTLPCVLLLLDFWPLGRTRFWNPGPTVATGHPDSGPALPSRPLSRLLLEKTPLLAASIASTAITWFTHPQVPLIDIDHSPASRLANAVASYVLYLWKLIWPTEIGVLHPFLESVPAWQAVGSALLLAAASFLVLRFASRRPHLATGWLWFLGTLLPVIKLYKLGLWYSIASRFAYLPYIGLYTMVAFEAEAIAAHFRLRPKALAAAALILLSALALVARNQVSHWSDSLSLYRHTLAVTKNNGVIHFYLALFLQNQNRQEKALSHFRAALGILPNQPCLHDYYGTSLVQSGRPAEAMAEFREALRLDPNYTLALNNLGALLNSLGRPAEAIEPIEKALRLKPDFADARVNLGVSLFLQGRPADALRHFEEALRLKPDQFMASYNKGAVLLALNRPLEAVAALEQALGITPDSVEAKHALAVARAKAAREPKSPGGP